MTENLHNEQQTRYSDAEQDDVDVDEDQAAAENYLHSTTDGKKQYIIAVAVAEANVLAKNPMKTCEADALLAAAQLAGRVSAQISFTAFFSFSSPKLNLDRH